MKSIKSKVISQEQTNQERLDFHNTWLYKKVIVISGILHRAIYYPIKYIYDSIL